MKYEEVLATFRRYLSISLLLVFSDALLLIGVISIHHAIPVHRPIPGLFLPDATCIIRRDIYKVTHSMCNEAALYVVSHSLLFLFHTIAHNINNMRIRILIHLLWAHIVCPWRPCHLRSYVCRYNPGFSAAPHAGSYCKVLSGSVSTREHKSKQDSSPHLFLPGS